MFPLFTNTALLAALTGLAVPILIHLLLRRKSQRLKFSTIQFFVKKDEQSSRKRKLRNYFLLMARLLLFALIVTAFARPYLPGNQGAAAGKRQQIIIILDASASMQANGLAGAQWSRAKEKARLLLAKLQPDDRAALITCASQTRTVSSFAPPPVVARLLADLQPTLGSSELLQGLRQASRLFPTAKPGETLSLHIISDLQRSACENLASMAIPQNVNVEILDPGDRYIPNVAVAELQLRARPQSEPHAQVVSFSDENYSAVRATLRFDGKEVLSQNLDLPRLGSTNIPISAPSLTPGWHNAEFALDLKDNFAADNKFYQSLFVPEPLRALVVEPRKTEKVYQEETFFAVAALDPALGSTNAASSRFAVAKTAIEKLSSDLSIQPGHPPSDFVLLPGIKQLSPAAVSALKMHVQNGGGLLLFLGENVSANRYNTELGELLPVSIGQPETSGTVPWRLGIYDKRSPMFAPFSQPNSGNLSIPEFTQRFTLAPKPESTVAAEFDDGTPLVVQRKFGKGIVLLVNTSADASWSDWPKHKSFVPWLHGAGRLLAGETKAESIEPPMAFLTGSDIDLELGAAAKKQSFRLQRSDGKETVLAADDQGRLASIQLDLPGIYSLKDASGREIRRFAANVPIQESDLSMLAPTEIQQKLARSADQSPSGLASLIGDSSRGKEVWRALLLAALFLMLIEPMIANRTLA